MIRTPQRYRTAAALLLACLPLTACIFASGRGDPVTGLVPGSAAGKGALSLKADKTVLLPGDTLTLAAALGGAATPLSNLSPSFTTSDAKVVLVDWKGQVTAVNVGQAVVTASWGAEKATLTFRVVTSTAPEMLNVASVAVSPGSQTVEKVGSQVVFTALARDSANTAIPGIAFYWHSSNPNVATISQAGVLTIVGSGSTEVTAAAGDKKSAASIISVPGGTVNVNVDFGAR